MEVTKEEREILKRLLDLANKSYNQNVFTFTDFLSQADIGLFYANEKEFSFVKYEVFGGTDDTERNMIRFGDKEELGYEEPFPIVCLKIKPLIEKFADELSHRDYLGALMNLGIERATLGDILINGKTAYLFANTKIQKFIEDNFDKVKHTSIALEIVENALTIARKEPVEREVMVASLRADIIISKLFNRSRSQTVELFREHKVFVNSRLYENNSGMLKENDMVSVRGYGRFLFEGIDRNTSKGKLMIKVLEYK